MFDTPQDMGMHSTTLTNLGSDTRYVIAIICNRGLTVADFVAIIKEHQFECIDVIQGAAEGNFDEHLVPDDEGMFPIPLLFLFSEQQLVLVCHYEELLEIESRRAA